MKKLLFVLLLVALLAGCGGEDASKKEVKKLKDKVEGNEDERKPEEGDHGIRQAQIPEDRKIVANDAIDQKSDDSNDVVVVALEATNEALEKKDAEPAAEEPKRKNESELPPGKPLEQLEQRKGKHFLGDSKTPFTGVVEERQNGKRIRLISFSDGLRHGTEYTFDANGFVLQEANYSEDYLDGKQIFWWPNGSKKEERVWVKSNRHPRELRRWNRDGRLIEEKIDNSF